MTAHLREALITALSNEPPLSRLQFHAWLYRQCLVQAGPIRNCVREPAWGGPFAEFKRLATLAFAAANWRGVLQERAIRWIREDATDRLLVFCAATLKALDEHHLERQRDVALEEVSLPLSLGGGRTLFLPPPATPLMDLIPRAQRLQRGVGDLENNLREILKLWWHVIKLEALTVQPRIRELDATVSKELAGRLAQGDLRFGLASPFAGLAYSIRSDPSRYGSDGIPYRFAELKPESSAAAKAGLLEILKQCAAQRVDVLCFPELTLDTDLQHYLRLLLKTGDLEQGPVLIVVGSFHVDSEGHWVNQCRALSGSGRFLFSQDKCVFYRIPPSQAEKDPHLCELLGIDHRGGYEDIHLSTSLEIFDGPLGRLATPICLDYCGDEVLDLLIDSAVNLLLVPAMTPRMEPFYQKARTLGTKAGAASFVTNSAWLLDHLGKREPENLALAYLPAHPVAKLTRDPADSLWVFSIRELLGLT